jgi:hypothetical protein
VEVLNSNFHSELRTLSFFSFLKFLNHTFSAVYVI